MILVDTNVLVRLIEVGHPHHDPALDALDLLSVRDGESFGVAPQNLYEFYVVCTRPVAANGLGLTSSAAGRELARAKAMFPLLPERDSVYGCWESLVATFGVEGKSAHDAHLVAFMIEHGIDQIFTFNDIHFRRFSAIRALNPFDVLGIPRV